LYNKTYKILIERFVGYKPVAVGMGKSHFAGSYFPHDDVVDEIGETAQLESRQILRHVDGNFYYGKDFFMRILLSC